MQPAIQARHIVWSISALLSMLVGAVACGVIVGLALRSPGAVTVGVSLGGALTGAAVLCYGLAVRCGWGLHDFGFRRGAHSLWHLLWWIPVTIVSAIVAVGVGTTVIGIEPSNSTQSKSEALSLGWGVGVTVFVSTALLIPMLEEIIFRRVLLDWLLAKLPVLGATIIAILIFAAIHLIPVAMIYALVLGTSMVIARLWFKTLTATLMIHIANNSLVVLVALIALS